MKKIILALVLFCGVVSATNFNDQMVKELPFDGAHMLTKKEVLFFREKIIQEVSVFIVKNIDEIDTESKELKDFGKIFDQGSKIMKNAKGGEVSLLHVKNFWRLLKKTALMKRLYK